MRRLPWLLGLLPPCALVGACMLPPSDTCVQYVECQQQVDASVDTAPWREGGDCWVNPQTAAVCDAQCEEALEALSEIPDAPEACLR